MGREVVAIGKGGAGGERRRGRPPPVPVPVSLARVTGHTFRFRLIRSARSLRIRRITAYHTAITANHNISQYIIERQRQNTSSRADDSLFVHLFSYVYHLSSLISTCIVLRLNNCEIGTSVGKPYLHNQSMPSDGEI